MNFHRGTDTGILLQHAVANEETLPVDQFFLESITLTSIQLAAMQTTSLEPLTSK